MDKLARVVITNLAHPEFALHWADKLGARPDSLTALHGGINNIVFSCAFGGKSSGRFVIKGYAQRLESTDRMSSEVEFLRYAGKVAPSYVPSLLAVDEERRCVVLEYVDGYPYLSGMSPSTDDVNHAGSFFHLLNTNKALAKESIKRVAVDGFLSLSEHIENVHRRLNLFTTEHLSVRRKAEANKLVQRVQREFEGVARRTHMLIGTGQIQDLIGFDDCCVSPSDFGFHNAIRNAKGVKFFDFEFAGWDDPAKTMLDFALQPRVPVADPLAKLFYQFARPFAYEQIAARSTALGPILRLKWVCIMLSVLRPDRLCQLKEVVQHSLSPDFIDQRLTGARLYLNKEFSFGLY